MCNNQTCCSFFNLDFNNSLVNDCFCSHSVLKLGLLALQPFLSYIDINTPGNN